MKTLGKLILVELKLFVREPITLVFTFILPLIMFIVMGEVFGKSAGISEMYRNVNAMDYYTPAYIGVVMAAVGLIAIPVHLAGYREKGILRRLRASSLPLSSLLAAQLAAGMIVTLVSMVFLVIPAYLVYHIQPPHDIGLVIAATLLGMFCFTALGVMLGFVLPNSRAAQGVGLPVYFLMYMISGAAPPRGVMTAIMQNVGQATPLWHVTTLIQDAWLGYGWNGGAALIVAAFLVAAGGVTFFMTRRE